jgi:excisionase family DNA binding protein
VAQAPEITARRAATAAESQSERATRARQEGEKLAYSVAEAARVLGLSHSMIYDQLRTGRLDSLKVGRRRIITRDHIERLLAGC